MSNNLLKHKHYEILNMLGYGLAKFNDEFIKQFGFETKTDFYNYIVKIGVAETVGVVKNRMDLFDPFFDNGRKGWWQKGDAYIHRKLLIDNLFAKEDVIGYSNVVKLYLQENFSVKEMISGIKPIQRTKFKKMQETGLEAELFFINNYQKLDMFKDGILEDARLYGDGYDFQVDVFNKSYLVEIKGIRTENGNFRMTENEYNKAEEYQSDYVLTFVLNLNDKPYFLAVENPLQTIFLEKRIVKSNDIALYYGTI